MLLAFLAAVAAPPVSEIRVGTYAYPRFDRREALRPLAALVERVSGRPVRIVLVADPDELARAVCDGKIDVAMTNLAVFVHIRACPRVGAIAVLDSPPAVLDGYRGVLLARRDADAATLAVAARHAGRLRYSEVLPGSTSGALVQADVWRSAGVSPTRFAALRRAGTHEAALDDLLQGRADVAALAEEPWRKLQAADPVKAATVRLLWRSEPLPPGPVICRQRVNVSCAAIRSALLGRDGAAVAAALSAGWVETRGATRFRRYERQDYGAFQAR